MNPVILNYGMGVESTTILHRWLTEPALRAFDLAALTVVSAQTGDGFRDLLETFEFGALQQLVDVQQNDQAPFELAKRNADQRFENWNERRALARPYFLRSTTRGSRVRKPPRLSAARKSGSKFVNALEMP